MEKINQFVFVGAGEDQQVEIILSCCADKAHESPGDVEVEVVAHSAEAIRQKIADLGWDLADSSFGCGYSVVEGVSYWAECPACQRPEPVGLRFASASVGEKVARYETYRHAHRELRELVARQFEVCGKSLADVIANSESPRDPLPRDSDGDVRLEDCRLDQLAVLHQEAGGERVEVLGDEWEPAK